MYMNRSNDRLRSRHILLGVAAIVVAIALAGCSASGSDTAERRGEQGDVTEADLEVELDNKSPLTAGFIVFYQDDPDDPASSTLIDSIEIPAPGSSAAIVLTPPSPIESSKVFVIYTSETVTSASFKPETLDLKAQLELSTDGAVKVEISQDPNTGGPVLDYTDPWGVDRTN